MTTDWRENFVREVTARYIGPRRRGLRINGPEDAARFMRTLLRDDAREHFFALYLNGAHHVVSFSLVSLGTANSAPACPREIFSGAVLVGAVALIIGHSHPSGDLTPSREDIAVTKKLGEASQVLGIPLLDHVVFSRCDYVSLKERGLVE